VPAFVAVAAVTADHCGEGRLLMRVNDVMTTSPICCQPTDGVERVATMMREHDCGAIPVCAANELVGIITDRDVTCRAVAGHRMLGPVSDVMTKPVYTVRSDDDVQVAIDVMEKKQVRRLPVVDGEGKIVGIIAPSDLAPIFASMNVADFLLAVSYWSRAPRAAA
jgi:CBS domain-containing protein